MYKQIDSIDILIPGQTVFYNLRKAGGKRGAITTRLCPVCNTHRRVFLIDEQCAESETITGYGQHEVTCICEKCGKLALAVVSYSTRPTSKKIKCTSCKLMCVENVSTGWLANKNLHRCHMHGAPGYPGMMRILVY